MPKLPAILEKALHAAKIDPTSASLRGNVLTCADGSTYFARTSHNITQITGEVESLRALATTCPEVVPAVYAFEIDLDRKEAGMVSQYFDFSSSSIRPARGDRNCQRELARRVARLHTAPPAVTAGDHAVFGFHVPTHCGVTEQDNSWEDSWEVFYRDRRLGDLVGRIGDQDINRVWAEIRDK
jgi:protein-ribulosamine 3-kinase